MERNGVCSELSITHSVTFTDGTAMISAKANSSGRQNNSTYEWYMIYLLTAIGFPPGGSSTVHIYTQTIHRTTQNKQYIEKHKNFGRVRAVPHLCGFYPDICLTTEEKTQENISHGSRRVPVGTMMIHKHIIRIHRHNNKNKTMEEFCCIIPLTL